MIKNFLIRSSVISAAVVLAGCSSGTKGEVVDMTAGKPKVRVELVSEESVPLEGNFTATVQANVKNNIAPSTPMRIDDITVEVGDHVKKGQVLVKMEADNLIQQQVQLQNLKVEFERAEALFKKGGTSKSDYDSRKTSYEVAKTAYDNLAENTVLVAPVSGIVTARNYDDGDLYNGQTQVLTIEEITPVKLYVNISESLFTYVKKGMPVSVKLDVYGDRNFEGTVSLVYPTIDPATRTFTVEIKIANKDEVVRPGMFARVNMQFGKRDNVVVPDLAIVKQSGSGERFVFVYKDGKVSYNKVELGRRLGDRYEVLSGVEPGDQVVVQGQTKLFDGTEVELIK